MYTRNWGIQTYQGVGSKSIVVYGCICYLFKGRRSGNYNYASLRTCCCFPCTRRAPHILNRTRHARRNWTAHAVGTYVNCRKNNLKWSLVIWHDCIGEVQQQQRCRGCAVAATAVTVSGVVLLLFKECPPIRRLADFEWCAFCDVFELIATNRLLSAWNERHHVCHVIWPSIFNSQ